MDYLKKVLVYTLRIAACFGSMATNLRSKEIQPKAIQGSKQASAVRGAMQRMRWVVHAKRDANRPHQPGWTAKAL
jgi:hypothetical protein